MPSSEKIQEIQLLEQGLHNILVQKQAFHMELSETKTALREVEGSQNDIFKIVGQLMIKSERSKVVDELKNKEKLLEIRLKTLEKQENSISEKLEALRDEVLNKKRPEKQK